MDETQRDDRLVSLADVARLAGVTRPAASNWRRRHSDFPKPVQETGAASLFELSAINAWLVRHGKELAQPSVNDEVAAALNRVRSVVTLSAAVDASLEALAAGKDQIEPYAEQIPELPRLVNEYGARAVCEALLAEAADQERRVPWLLPAPGLVDLVMALARPHLRGVVYDPACGLGSLLMSVHRTARNLVQLIGDNDNNDMTRLAGLRSRIHDAPVNLRTGGRVQQAEADMVLSVIPADRDAGAAVSHAARLLKQGGRGIQVSPHSLVTQGGEHRRTRRDLVRAGMVEAVIELPRGLYEGNATRSALWLLHARGEARVSDILLVDASMIEVGAGGVLAAEDIASVVDTVLTWQKGGVQPGRCPVAVVDEERLLSGECRMDAASWLRKDDAPGDAVERFAAARLRFSQAAADVATATLPSNLVKIDARQRPIRELVRLGVAELFRGARLVPVSDGDSTPVIGAGDLRDDWTALPTATAVVDEIRRDHPTTRRGDVVIAVSDQRIRAAVVEKEGAIVQAPLQCLRLRKSSMARARVLAALLSAGQRPVRYAEVRDLVVPWPDDEQCAHIAWELDHLVELRRKAAEAAVAADALMANALVALSAGSVPADELRDAP